MHVKLGSQPARSRRINDVDQVRAPGTAENPRQDGNRSQLPDLDCFPDSATRRILLFLSEHQALFGFTPPLPVHCSLTIFTDSFTDSPRLIPGCERRLSVVRCKPEASCRESCLRFSGHKSETQRKELLLSTFADWAKKSKSSSKGSWGRQQKSCRICQTAGMYGI